LDFNRERLADYKREGLYLENMTAMAGREGKEMRKLESEKMATRGCISCALLTTEPGTGKSLPTGANLDVPENCSLPKEKAASNKTSRTRWRTKMGIEEQTPQQKPII